jgi:sugar phosphate isomerase/epimerase
MQLGLTPDTRWETDVHTFVEAAHRAGFSTLGIHSGLVDAQAPSAFTSMGLGCHELLGIVINDDVSATMTWAKRLVDEAAAMNARWVSTTFAAPLTDDTAALVARCAAMFAEAGSGMAIESSPLGPVPTIRAGLDMVAAAGVERAGLVIDSWNFSFSSDGWDDLEEVPLDRIAYLQFADALSPATTDRMDEALNRRAMPGDGVLELDRFTSTLRQRGFDGVVSVQVLSAELRRLPLPDFARLAHDAAARYWMD